MSKIIAVKAKPQAVTELAAELTLGGVTLNWRANPIPPIRGGMSGEEVKPDVYQVWTSTIDDLNTATMVIDDLADATYTYALPAGTKTLSIGGGPYFWVRAKNSFGVVGDWGPYTWGAELNTRYFVLVATAFQNLTLHVGSVEAKIYYTDFVGTASNTGFVQFTTAPTQSDEGDADWVDPQFGVTDDASFANVTLPLGGLSEYLYYKVSDIGLPAEAKITGMEVRVKGKVVGTSGGNLMLFGFLTDADKLAMGESVSFSNFGASNVVGTVTAGSENGGFGTSPVNNVFVYSDKIPRNAVPSTALGNDTETVVLNAYGFSQAKRSSTGFFSASSGQTVSVGTTFTSIGLNSPLIALAPYEPVTAYSTWQDVYASNGFIGSPGPKKVFATISCDIDWSNLIMTTGTASIELQIALRNVGGLADFSTETFTLARWSGAGQLLLSAPIFHLTWLFEKGRSYSSIPDNSVVDVRVRLRKLRSDAGTSFTVNFNRLMIETSFE